jgi:hypothetical protein
MGECQPKPLLDRRVPFHQFQGNYWFRFVSLKRQNNIPDSDEIELGQIRKRSDTVSTVHSDSHDQKGNMLQKIQE